MARKNEDRGNLVYVIVKDMKSLKVVDMSCINPEDKSVEMTLMAEEIEFKRFIRMFPVDKYSLQVLYGGRLRINSPEERYERAHPECKITVDDVLKREDILPK